MGLIDKVQHCVGSAAEFGSTSKKQISAFAVARLLCGKPPGIHTPDLGGTIQRVPGTSHVTPPRSARTSWPFLCLWTGVSFSLSDAFTLIAIAGAKLSSGSNSERLDSSVNGQLSQFSDDLARSLSPVGG
jgi:hypothetical protein